MGSTMSSLSRVLLVLAALACVAAAVQRTRPADWDEEVDGTWEPPKDYETPEPSTINKPQTPQQPPQTPQYPPPPPPEQYLSQGKEAWKNNFETTRLWEVINKDDAKGLAELMKANPRVIHARAEDGRGPLFWAYEYGRATMIKTLEDAGVDKTVKDKDGKTPPQMAPHQ